MRRSKSTSLNPIETTNERVKVNPHSTFYNNFPQPTSKDQRTLLLRDKLIMQGEKRETSTQNRENEQRNNVARHVEGFCILFRRLYSRVGRWPAPHSF